MFKSAWIYGSAALLSLTLVACGSGGNIGTGTGTDPGTGGTPTPTPTTPTFRAGTLSGTTFSEGALALGSTQLSAGGQTSVTVDIVDSAGQRVIGTNATVTFSSDCAAAQQSRFDPASVTTTQGRASTTYVASGCSGGDILRASVLVDGATAAVTAQASLNVTPAEIGSLSFVSATPQFVGMRGSPISNQSILVFQLSNANGGAAVNRRVVFEASNSVGGLQVSPTESTTDSNGLVQTTLLGGSAQTLVRVKATATTNSGQPLSTQSEQLIVSTGLPDADSVSMSVEKFSIDGRCDGEADTITLRLADRYNNPVPDGTAVAFTTEGGKINSGCNTSDPLADPGTEAGVCSVLLVVQNPRPTNGRVSILASASGEESFVDNNSNGFFDPAETFTDILEPFQDDNENGVRDTGERFRDRNGNDQFDAAANGAFDGYVCDSPGVNCRSTVTPLGANAVIVFYNGQARIGNLTGNQATYTPSATARISLRVADTNGNSLPTGTTFTLNVTNGSVAEPATQGPFNTTNGDALSYRFTTTATATPPGGQETASLTASIPANTCGAAENITFDLFTYTVQ
ncbi:MAG: hypothetical protein V4709_08705 [Pseudomonadota bacterium]